MEKNQNIQIKFKKTSNKKLTILEQEKNKKIKKRKKSFNCHKKKF